MQTTQIKNAPAVHLIRKTIRIPELNSINNYFKVSNMLINALIFFKSNSVVDFALLDPITIAPADGTDELRSPIFSGTIRTD